MLLGEVGGSFFLLYQIPSPEYSTHYNPLRDVGVVSSFCRSK